ncbi:B-cell receptor CD22-like isoform X4 [Megalobrama amblycephala]|uniref:B-cell receptor CD22-like isoform X4 n=1 Tax=Megalobrama amblycephala TaxID=75352 RepID=UPI002013F96D|nr:B-cell receptor CD22-like isoform X4 [Megalobrama amblycephala]
MLMCFKMALPVPLIFLLMIHGVSSADWGVSYKPLHICALNNSSVIMSCTFTYPTGHQISKVFWTKDTVRGKEPPDLSEDPEYSQRLQYLGDKQQNCTMRLSHVTQKDSNKYYFRFITNKFDGKWIGTPGVTLTVTDDFDLQVESPERVTEGDSVRLTCKSSCTLTDRATFIWYRNSQPLTERRDRNNELLLQSVRRKDAGRYSCAVHGHNHTSPAVQLNVMYPPRSISVSISPSGEIVSGDSVTLNCSSDSNPPAEISWFKGETFVRAGRIYSISKISSDDSGEYKCKSINEHGEKYSDAVTLNVMYPPRNVSVLIKRSGEIMPGDSVTLICSSDSNPPALNFRWFKENESSAVGSRQSFSALQSGRFYCQAHNQHGSQRSDAVTVTVHHGAGRNVIENTAASGGFIVIIIIMFIIIIIIIIFFILKKQRSVKTEDPTAKQNNLHSDASQRVSVHDEPLSEPDSANDAPYDSVKPNRFGGKTPESRDTEEDQYTTAQHLRKEEKKRLEETECQNDDIRVHLPEAAV